MHNPLYTISSFVNLLALIKPFSLISLQNLQSKSLQKWKKSKKEY